MNKHYQTANEDLALIDFADDEREERLQILLSAQAEATLALSYEQRTANLIALFGDGGTDDAHATLLNTITERLGLK